MRARIVHEICRTISEDCGERPDVTEFVISSCDAMPRMARLGVWTATLLFGAAGWLYGSRARQWRIWRAHPVELARDFTRLYEVLVMMALYSPTPESRAATR